MSEEVLHRWPRLKRHRWRKPVICTAADRQRTGFHLNTYRAQGLVIGVWLVVPWSRRYLSWVWPVWIEVGENRHLRWMTESEHG